MKLWTIQPESVYKMIERDGTFRCDPRLSECITEMIFSESYDWMVTQMCSRIGNPPANIQYPVWAWHTLEWKHQKPDLRKTEFRHHKEKMVCLEIEVPDNEVLLSDEENWHFVLNDYYLGDSTCEDEWNTDEAWFDSLSAEEQEKNKRKSWEKIFDIATPVDTGWYRSGRYIQATFWELKSEYIVAARFLYWRNI